MTDPIKQIEAELSAMQPSPLARDLAERVGSELNAGEARVSLWPDRFLLSAICSGALAACVILAVLVGGAMGSNAPAGAMEMSRINPHAPGSIDAPLAFAQSDPAMVEFLK